MILHYFVHYWHLGSINKHIALDITIENHVKNHDTRKLAQSTSRRIQQR
jgi:hypothetical protein